MTEVRRLPYLHSRSIVEVGSVVVLSEAKIFPDCDDKGWVHFHLVVNVVWMPRKIASKRKRREMEKRAAEAVLAVCMMHRTEAGVEHYWVGSIGFLDSEE